MSDMLDVKLGSQTPLKVELAKQGTGEDTNTTYSFEIDGNKLIITPSQGDATTLILPSGGASGSTTYTLSLSDNILALVSSTGETQSVTLPTSTDTNTTYTLSISGSVLTLQSSDGEKQDVSIPVGNAVFTTGTGLSSIKAVNSTDPKASGSYSFAEGSGTTASGNTSHAEGYYTTASGNAAHTEGEQTTASGSRSHAEGVGTIANHRSQYAMGEYNIADTNDGKKSERGDYIQVIGNGTSDTKRSNAYTLDWDGNGWFAGELSADGGIIIPSSTSGSTKKFKITVDDTGALTATEVTA